MKKLPTYHDDLIKRLKNRNYAMGYLNFALEDGDEDVFLLAARDVAEAQGGFRKLAKQLGLSREHLFRMFSKKGNPTFRNLSPILKALGFRIVLKPASLDKAA